MMRGGVAWAVILGVLNTSWAVAESPPSTEETNRSGKVLARVEGDAELERRVQDDGTAFYYSGVHRVTTPLPAGYPPPTPPGAIEIKSYPPVRRATFTGKRQGPDGMRNSKTGFWPLFAHIKSRGIAMTAPVEIEYEGLKAGDEDGIEGWSMSFLYRTKDVGPKESYAGIEVADAKPVTVFAIGVAGDATRAAIDQALRQLDEAVRASDRWQQQGDPRIMGYNGPDVPQPERWSEVQVPVVEVEKKE